MNFDTVEKPCRTTRKTRVPLYGNKVCETTCRIEPEPCDPCETGYAATEAVTGLGGVLGAGVGADASMGGWNIFLQIVAWFIIFTVFYWLIYYSTNPTWLFVNGVQSLSNILLAAVITALVTLIVFAIIYALVRAFGGCATPCL